METLNLSVRVDANDKKNFEQFCNNVGMNVSTAIPCLTVRDKNGSKSLVKLGFSFFYYCVLYTYYDILVYEG